MISRGFTGRRRPAEVEGRLPPGQYLVTDFPVLSAGPTPRTPLDRWSFTLDVAPSPVVWTWDQFLTLPSQVFTVDISCVTKWTKLDTTWRGVPPCHAATLPSVVWAISFIASRVKNA